MVRLSISPVAVTKDYLYGVEGNSGLQKVNSNSGRCINSKDWTGVHSSLEVLSLDKQHGMKGKQITAGKLIGTEQGITMQYQTKRSYDIRLGNTTIYIDRHPNAYMTSSTSSGYHPNPLQY